MDQRFQSVATFVEIAIRLAAGSAFLWSAVPKILHPYEFYLDLIAYRLVSGSLAAWISDPQHIKPGNLMPKMALRSDKLIAILHYLEQLQ